LHDSLLASTTHTLHNSQVHCCGVIQWWACSSLMCAPLPAGANQDC